MPKQQIRRTPAPSTPVLQIAIEGGRARTRLARPAQDAMRAGAIFPGSTSIAEDIASVRLLMRIVGLRSPEIDAVLAAGDRVAALVDKLNTVGARADAPVLVLKVGGREYNIAIAARRTK